MKNWLLLFCCTISSYLFCQKKVTLSPYLMGQYSKTLYDRTINNNQAGVGAGLQIFFNNESKWKPVVEFAADAYLLDDKVLRTERLTDSTFKGVETANSTLTLFGGVSFHPAQQFFVSFTAGPGIVSNRLLFGIKPLVGFFFSKTKRWMGKVSYLNLFNRYKPTGQDFGAVSFAVGVKLF